MEKVVIARWESKKGKDWVEVVKGDSGYSYQSRDAGGWLAASSAAAAVAEMESRVASGQFASQKSPMKLVAAAAAQQKKVNI